MYFNHQTKNLAKEFSPEEWSGAVNLLIVEDKLALIVRSQEVSTHRGQIAFLGGHKEEGELSPLETAQREFVEETNLCHKDIQYYSCLNSVRTGGGKKIIPVVGEYKGSPKEFLKKVESNGEWTDLILVKMSYLSDQKNWQRVKTNYQTGDLFFVPIISESYLSTGSTKESYMLWGATAKMLWYYFKMEKKFL